MKRNRLLSNALWKRIQPLLPTHDAKHPLGCHRQRVPDRQVMAGILFVLRAGCQWKMLDETGICSGSTAHARFQEWTQAGVFLEFWRQGLLAYDKRKGIAWRYISMDGSQGKAPLGGEASGRNPTDRGKLGVKRSVLTDARGIPLGIAVSGANTHDSKLFVETWASMPVEMPDPQERVIHLCLDKGYDYPHLRIIADYAGFRSHIRSRGEEQQRKRRGQKARRWVVERTHSWFNQFRGLLIRWSKKAENHLSLLHLAAGMMAFRAIASLD